jgi:Fur family ferric uptake transcriptional regulator
LAADVTASRARPRLRVESVEEAVEELRAHGLRVSAARRLVLEALFATDTPLSAAQVADGIAGRIPRSDVASVYRNLETFEELGLVRHVHLGHGPSLFALAHANAREYVICESCDAVRAYEPTLLDAVRAAVRNVSGFEARFDHFPLAGRCPTCADSQGT